MDQLIPWLGPVIAAASLIYTILTTRSKAASERVTKAEARLDVLEDRVIRVEGTLQHLPDKDVTHRLELSLRDVRAEIQVMSERMKPISSTCERLQEAIDEMQQPGSRHVA